MDKDMISAVMSAMGKKGGKIGGKSRMAALTPGERSALAKKAADKATEVRQKKAAMRRSGKD